MVLPLSYTFGALVTPPPTPGSGPGEALRARRMEIGKRQDDLASDAEVSQKLISEIERGEQSLLAVGIGRARNIARALNWSLNDLQEATGLDLGVERPAPKPSDAFTAKARGYRVPKPPRPALPDSLIEAGRLYGDKPGLQGLGQRRWQYYMADLPHRRRPQTPEEWLALYIDLRDRYDPPEVEE